jgi:hypothetical protein
MNKNNLNLPNSYLTEFNYFIPPFWILILLLFIALIVGVHPVENQTNYTESPSIPIVKSNDTSCTSKQPSAVLQQSCKEGNGFVAGLATGYLLFGGS